MINLCTKTQHSSFTPPKLQIRIVNIQKQIKGKLKKQLVLTFFKYEGGLSDLIRLAKDDFTAVATATVRHSTLKTPPLPALKVRTHLISPLLNGGIMRFTILTTLAIKLGWSAVFGFGIPGSNEKNFGITTIKCKIASWSDIRT